MLKFTSLAVGLLTAISIVPAAQARPIYDSTPVIIHQPQNNYTPVVVSVTSPTYRGSEYHQGWTADRYRQMELVREREARARWEARHRRQHYYGRYHNSSNDRDDRAYNDRRYHGEYRHNR